MIFLIFWYRLIAHKRIIKELQNMNKNTLCVSAYWRNSLADADLGRGGWHENNISSNSIRPRSELISAFIDKTIVADYFKTEAADVDEVEVAIYPFLFKLRTEHGSRKQYALPPIITPVIIKGNLSRDGNFIPLPKIFVARDLLEPLDKSSFSIGHIDQLDEYLTNNSCPVPDDIVAMSRIRKEGGSDGYFDDHLGSSGVADIWSNTLAYCEDLLSTVARDGIITVNGYLRTREWMIRKIGGSDTPSKRISSLYDHLRQSQPACPLLDTFASNSISNTKPPIGVEQSFDRHLGHCSDGYPLVYAQRDAINHIIGMNDGEILAVNGPPGTGKTTLLITVVANAWIESALQKGNPPVIVAASSNNQSVTNILDAFKKDISRGEGPFAGRWISAVDSFGFYMASRSMRQKLGVKYLNQGFFDSIESVEGIAQAGEDYLYYAREAFPEIKSPSIARIVDALHEKIVEESSKLSEIKSLYNDFNALSERISRALGEDYWESLDKIERDAEEAKKRHSVFENAYIDLINHIGRQPFWYDFLKFIPSVSRQQGVRASIVVKRSIKGISPDKIWSNVDNLKKSLSEKTNSLKKSFQRIKMRQRKAHAIVRKMNDTKFKLMDSYKYLMDEGSPGLQKNPENLFEASVLADTKIRFNLFLLATHYWEGRWLLEVGEQELELMREMGSSEHDAVMRRWRRRMMLTPCAVSTFFMLPSEFRVLHDNGDQKHDYLYNFIDLLIIDEAGQSLPEVAGASFALAKKSIVIGDTFQIEPIWNIPKSVDIGNLVHHGVLKRDFSEDDLAEISMSGKMASNGNVMTIAQAASLYHYDKELPRGMFLYEHRRCFNEIISYCNALSYKNRLIPSRGRHKDLQMPPNPFPPMAYVNVFGQCKSKVTGTRYNLLEANTIAKFISQYKDELEKMYGKRIEEIIGIVTPFTGQVDLLRTSLRKYNIDVSPETGITFGTVHSLQGAERSIVIFSPTYTKENNGGFIDLSPSMLNVAVSRAKDTFIVFGDMRTFNPKQSFSPRGLLATFLLRSDENKIEFKAD